MKNDTCSEVLVDEISIVRKFEYLAKCFASRCGVHFTLLELNGKPFATDNTGSNRRAKEPTLLFHMNIRKSQIVAGLPDNMTHFCFAFVSDLLFPPKPQQVNDVDVTELKQGIAW